MLVSAIPIAINLYEVSVNLLTFDYSYIWTSVAAGGAFAVYWILTRVIIEATGSEDLATIMSEKSQGAFIYYIWPDLGDDIWTYSSVTLTLFVGVQALVHYMIVLLVSHKTELGAGYPHTL